MTSWYSNILTKTSSQISNLRSTLLANEADGDTDDDTHVCRVLRNYYADKGRPLPSWLPPDPKAPPPPQPAQVLYAQAGSRYGGGNAGFQQQQGGHPGQPQQQQFQQQQQQPSGLSSLWDTSGPAGASPQPASLRAGRQGGLTPQGRPAVGGRDDVAARPLPSQRAGSYQSVGSNGGGGGGAGGAGSAQDRLRQRLWGGGGSAGSRSTSPGQGAGGQGPYQAPGHKAGGGGGGGGGERPYMSANSPWASGDDPYGGGGGGGRPPPPGGDRRQGLPSGPRGYR